jgi:hypothetical protein
MDTWSFSQARSERSSVRYRMGLARIAPVRRRRFRLALHSAAGQKESQTNHLFAADLFFEVSCARF